MKKYQGKWVDLFNVKIHDGTLGGVDRSSAKGKIILETPDYDYLFTREQWEEFKVKVNEV
jgi:hypothetical protein